MGALVTCHQVLRIRVDYVKNMAIGHEILRYVQALFGCPLSAYMFTPCSHEHAECAHLIRDVANTCFGYRNDHFNKINTLKD